MAEFTAHQVLGLLVHMCMRVCVDKNVASWPKLVSYLALYQPSSQMDFHQGGQVNPSNKLLLPSTKVGGLTSIAT